MRKSKRLSSLVMAVIMIVFTLAVNLASVVPVSAAGEVVLKLHYHREDAKYDGWDVWSWAEGHDGAAYPFAEEDGEMVATIEVEPGTSSVGFIVRTEDWTKDFDGDQFIDISEMVSGTVDVYVESGQEGFEKKYRDDAVIGTKLKNAKYNGDGTITVTMTGEIEGDTASVFSVAGKTGPVGVAGVKYDGDFLYTVTLEEELVNSKSYTITFEETAYPVRMPSIYSTKEFEDEFYYDGDDLGATWTKEKTTFRVWAPTAEEMSVNLYESGTETSKDLIETIPMTADVKGTWVAEKEGDLNGTYYTYNVTIDGVKREACDPYARTTGVNGKRAMVIDLDSTNPDKWDSDSAPHAGKGINEAIIYELHLRDLSTDESSGIKNVGKFLSLTETGTKTPSGIPTGIDHIKELGATHVHLLPFYDFGSVNETFTKDNLFNWGYDPQNYNVPEGSYSTDPYNGEVRVAEAKQMVQAMHENGLGIVMDVVYNHVQSAESFSYNVLVPGYFSRVNEDGSYSNGSGCGNDTASERLMVKKFIVESVNYWADEYHIDGFRFDLVGLLDAETINEVVETVHETHPDVIFYGEGWDMQTNVTKDNVTLATMFNADKMPNFAFFNDSIRDGLKGNVFDSTQTGFVSGANGMESKMQDCFLGADSWCPSPSQTINYASCHDNNTLFDRLQVSRTDASREDLIRMNNLAASMYMLAEGVPFLQAGEEMLRSKPNEDGTFNSNSYSSGDEVNSLKWSDLDNEEYMDVFNYYKGLISFRKAHAALRLSTAEEVAAAVKVVDGLDKNVVAFDIDGTKVKDETAKEIFVVYNANDKDTTVELPKGRWTVCINDEKAGTEKINNVSGKVKVAPISSMVLVRDTDKAGVNYMVFVVIGAIVVVAAAAVAIIFKKKK